MPDLQLTCRATWLRRYLDEKEPTLKNFAPAGKTFYSLSTRMG